MKINVTVNKIEKTFDIEPHEAILEVLRRYGYLSVKRGCDTGNCGVCTILIDNTPINSCSFLAARADGLSITTVEGVKEEAEKIANCLVTEGVDQCGFCSPALVLSTIAMKSELVNPTDDDILHYLTGNLCRCTGYVGQLRAIRKYLEE